MAHGRILSKDICCDKKVHDLSSDTCRLAFSWAITYLDRDGRMAGDPAVAKSLVFPRREEITTEQFAQFIQEWSDKGLVVWYEAAGDHWLFFPRFRKHQPNLPYAKEAPSRIPAPPGDSGPTPEEVRPNGREEKRREENTGGAEAPPDKKSAIPRLITAYHDAYLERTKQKPTVSGGRWGEAFKRWLRCHSEEDIRRVMAYFFAYSKRTQFGFDKFQTAFDNLAPAALGKKALAGPSGAREWKCTECGRVNNHNGYYCLTPGCEGEPGGKAG